MGKLDDIVLGKRYSGTGEKARQAPPQFAEGKITKVTSDGITFTIPSYDAGKHSWGPAPYAKWDDPAAVNDGGSGASAHKHVLVGPSVGDRCLILFPTGTTTGPWVIGWWPS